jgi:hypothetical protein
MINDKPLFIWVNPWRKDWKQHSLFGSALHSSSCKHMEGDEQMLVSMRRFCVLAMDGVDRGK